MSFFNDGSFDSGATVKVAEPRSCKAGTEHPSGLVIVGLYLNINGNNKKRTFYELLAQMLPLRNLICTTTSQVDWTECLDDVIE